MGGRRKRGRRSCAQEVTTIDCRLLSLQASAARMQCPIQHRMLSRHANKGLAQQLTSGVSRTSAAPTFSSSRPALLVPAVPNELHGTTVWMQVAWQSAPGSMGRNERRRGSRNASASQRSGQALAIAHRSQCSPACITWDGNDVITLCQQPGQGQLGGCAALALCNRRHLGRQLAVVLKCFSREARLAPAPEVLFPQLSCACKAAGQQPSSQGGVGQHPNAQLSKGGHDIALRIAAEQAPLQLHA